MKRIYAYPTLKRDMGFIVADSIAIAKEFNAECRLATIEEVSAALCTRVQIPVLNPKKEWRPTFALPEDFLGERGKRLVVPPSLI